MGMVDQVVPAQDLLRASVALIREACASGTWRSIRTWKHESRPLNEIDRRYVDTARLRLKCEFYGYPAPLKALQIIEESMNLPLSDAYPLEHAATLELAQDRRGIVQGSVGLFLL
jgi:hypothetical protein